MGRRSSTRRVGLRDSLADAGFIYNLGNFIGFFGGMVVFVSTVVPSDPRSSGIVGTILNYVFGDAAALLMTASTLVFFVGGRAYERGAASGRGPYWGDILSGVGAILLGAALMALGSPVLAATSGLLHAAGKFGSAVLTRSGSADRLAPWSDAFRITVLASRTPAFAVAALQLSAPTAGGPGPTGLALPAVMMACYLLWSFADILLIQSVPLFHYRAAAGRP